jgi:ATP-dependent protease HslVU (ClpYQ) ATPase subunit
LLLSAHHQQPGVNSDERAKEAFRAQLQAGQCDELLIEVDLPPKTSAQDGAGRTGIAFDISSANIVASELFSKLSKGGAANGGGKKREHKRMKISEAR